MLCFRNAVAGLIGAWLLTSGGALAQSVPSGVAIGDSAKGKLLTDSRGLSLYVFDQDKTNMSNCYEKCLALWPLFKAPDGAAAVGGFTVVNRDDGAKQWAYQGHPLYFYSKDAAPGDILGDGVRDIWHLAKP